MHLTARIALCAPFLCGLSALSTAAQDAVPAEGNSGTVPPAVKVPATFGPDGGFPFDLRTDDVAETFTDLSWMNPRPADRRITVRNGHYAFADTGERVRFWGTNLGAAQAFPSHAQADLVARRLSKLGVNIVRLHHIDNEWMRDDGFGTLWPPTGPHDRFVPDELDKLDYLIAALNREGIYVNLNLKVSKELSEADGMPPGWDEIPFVHQKRVDRFFPQLIEHQKWYARELLTRVNPHNGLTHAENPGVAFLEINNENSIMHLWPGQPIAAGLDEIPDAYLAELQAQWNDWLAARYPTDAHVRRAWAPQPSARQGEKVATPRALEANGIFGAEMTVKPGDRNVILVTQTSGTDWHAQALLLGLDLQDGEPYTLRFRAAAETPRPVRVSAERHGGDYGNIGLNETVRLGREPQSFSLPFTAGGVNAGGGNRVAFNVGSDTGEVIVTDLQISFGQEAETVEGSLADASFPVPGRAGGGRGVDWVAFLADTERRMSDDLRALLRDELGIDKPIADSQLQWGGSSALHREGLGMPTEVPGSDFVDTHNYWQHPDFVGGDWNPANWTIGNSSLVAALARGENGSLGIAENRVAGKPFGVSEIDQPAPSDWAVELVPIIGTFAAAQDWDVVYTFEAGPYADPDAPLDNYFSHLKHTSKAGQYPAAAATFRMGLVPPIEATATLHAPDPLYPLAATIGGAWTVGGAGLDPFARVSHRMRIQSVEGETTGVPTPITTTVTPGASPLSLTADHGGLYTAASDRAAFAVGFLGDEPIRLGNVTFTPAKEGLRYGSVSLVALDGEVLADSTALLLTVIGRAQNSDMGWNDARTSVSTRWGRTPMRVQTPALEIELPREGLRAWALDPTGARKAEVPVEGRVLRVTPEHETIYYEVRSR